MSVLLNCKDLSKNYRETAVFRDLCFQLAAGESLLVSGSNGSGKSTLLSILAGMVQGTAGEVQLLGERLTPMNHSLRRQIGFSQASENSLFLNATVRENLEFWARLYGLRRAPKTYLDELAESWGFASYLHRSVRELSSGFRRRVALARAFLHSPALVLLDEPFAFLDNNHRERTSEILANWIRARNGALVLSSNVDFSRDTAWKLLDLNSMSNTDLKL